MKTAIGIRFYEENPEKLKELEVFVRDVSKKVDLVFVIVNNEADSTNAYEHIRTLNLPKTQVFLMNIWGKFTPALNAITYSTALLGVTHLFFCSPEIGLTSKVLEQLLTYMDEDTLVVGARLDGHEFKPGISIATGNSIPWNTLAVWNLKFLIRTGFMLVSDAPFNPSIAGIEEFSTCAVQQKLYPEVKIKLANIPGILWNTQKLGVKRMASHLKKMETKKIRAEKQLEFMKVEAPKVIHVE